MQKGIYHTSMAITASKLYDYLTCPHRVWRDEYGPQEEKDAEPNPFVQMLWEQGLAYENERLLLMGEVVDVQRGTIEERAAYTIKIMHEGAPVIYQAVLRIGNLLGVPDILRREPDGSYIPIDIKSGVGVEGVEDDEENGGKFKKKYAVQLALYVDALQQLGFTTAYRGNVLDIRGKEVAYDLLSSQGPRTPETYWQLYERTRESVAALLSRDAKNDPAMIGACKLCPWYKSCKQWVAEQDDLTGLFFVGRKVRDVLVEDAGVKTIGDLCAADTGLLIEQKSKNSSFLSGIGEKSLNSAVTRAKVLRERKEPILYENLVFPSVPYELFFDIEDDPTQEFVYMHGVYERSLHGERYLDFTATEVSAEAEHDAWRGFWDYVRSLPSEGFVVYYYSKHERTIYRKMRERYPDVISENDLEIFFAPNHAIDLYGDVILKKTDWPLGSYSIKAIAQYLGFRWRDETPSGTLSIQWFNEYVTKKDPTMLDRIRLYNEDDCKATMVVKDALVHMNRQRIELSNIPLQ